MTAKVTMTTIKTTTIIAMTSTIMREDVDDDMRDQISPLGLLRLQSWLSPTFPIGTYSYSHGIEWAVDAGQVHDRDSLVEWLDADLRYGSGRNEAILLREAWRHTADPSRTKLLRVVELASALRGTSELALESSQQAAACLATLREVWPDRALDWLAQAMCEHQLQPALSVVLGIRAARQGIPARLALVAFLNSYVANLVTAGVRLVPLGQTDGQLAIATVEHALLALAAEAEAGTIDDLGSAALMVDFASTWHETQYTRLFRS
ncbi:MAG TPA: urease accessory protein UreF [Xanthobacteraceae bacterium]|nr:urease accessory protein UreF [Xanthobacteraceae bacterium]